MELRTPESQKWRVLTTAQIVTECTTSNPQLDRFVSQVEALTGARGNAQLVPAGVRLQKLLLNLAVVSPLGGVANEHLGDMAESRGDPQSIVGSVGRGDHKAVCWITKTKAIKKEHRAWRPGEVLGGGTPGAPKWQRGW